MDSERLRGYEALAAAIIEQTVHDVTQGTALERKVAVAAIRDGVLEPWLNLLCERYDVYEAVQVRLHKLAYGAA